MQATMRGNVQRQGWVKATWVGAFALAALAGSGLGSAGRAEPPSLEGSWRGGGSVALASGAREEARCRANFRRRTSTSYTLRAVCATPSIRAEQTATVRQVGSNRFAGNFYNSEYNVSGTIQIRVRGSSQDVRLTSSAGWAHFRLQR
jgi:hypothetical protein